MTRTLKTFRLTFFVPGSPAAQGSKRHIGGGRMIEQSRNVAPWRERIALAAHNFTIENNQLGLPTHNQALSATFKFVMPRPASTRKTIPTPAIKRPDLDKLCRAVFDALTGIIYSDDSAIIVLDARKRLAAPNESPGVHIAIEALP